jgi:hypothetical protein
MIEQYIHEEWKDFGLNDCDPSLMAYKISNYGRVKVKTKTQTSYRFFTKFLITSGFYMFFYKKTGDKAASYYVHRAVAILFIENKENKRYVIHLDHNPLNNSIINLAWANKTELTAHRKNNPKWIRGRNRKLNEGRVRIIKRKLMDPNNKTRVKMIAKQFGISTMQVWRIKSGENWGYVKVDMPSKK